MDKVDEIVVATEVAIEGDVVHVVAAVDEDVVDNLLKEAKQVMAIKHIVAVEDLEAEVEPNFSNEGKGMVMEGWRKAEEEGSTSRQSRQGKGFEDSHKEYFQQTNVHFEAQAEYWFGAYTKARGKVLWPVFVRGLTARFAKLFKESMVGEFHKLRQVGTLEQYYNEFEALRSIMVNEGYKFDDNYFTHNFISGLKDEIRLEVDKFEV
ncbi:hypothetical protein RJ640_000550 [Escallonia rubra]|uniref:Retrotransposon gag domain-containing protein n=1 Tax=Escallonia rubra TaxID=112253 RepID=A0AA88RQY3_9ASTE|nr:hypothetical protein RJ640_000550 [Escallonia rubra]